MSMKHIYTVKQLNAYIYNLFDNEPFLHSIRVTGEVSNYSAPRSGHIYFSLKDESGKIQVAMFRSARGGLTSPIRDGMQVVIDGEVTVYPRGGTYQVIAKKIVPKGTGDLFEQYELLKKTYEKKGYFDEADKKPIPRYAKNIGIVTAKSGAVIRDMVRIITRRNPHINILLYPVMVQGEKAAAQIAEGLYALDALGLDVIITGRGGGSIEDLWVFNEPEVAEAIYHCMTPVVSAVGHETDTTIADYVADKRAATPSEAAELCAFDYGDFIKELAATQSRLDRRMKQLLNREKRTLAMQADKLSLLHPKRRLIQQTKQLAEKGDRLMRAMAVHRKQEEDKLRLYAGRLNAASPSAKLAAGFSYAMADGENIKSIADVNKDDQMTTYVTDGRIVSVVVDTKKGYEE